jgi:hypothetical protein
LIRSEQVALEKKLYLLLCFKEAHYSLLSLTSNSTGLFNCLVPEQPTNLQGEPTSPNSIQLTWDPPQERNTGASGSGGSPIAIDGYELYYNDSHFRQNVRVTIAPPVNTYRLDDLTPNTVYHIRLAARSAARGEGASTPTIQVRTPDFGMRLLTAYTAVFNDVLFSSCRRANCVIYSSLIINARDLIMRIACCLDIAFNGAIEFTAVQSSLIC